MSDKGYVGSRTPTLEADSRACRRPTRFPFCPPNAQPWKDHPLVQPVAAPADPATKSPYDPVGASLRPPGGTRILNLDQADLFYAPNPTLAFIAIRKSAYISPPVSTC